MVAAARRRSVPQPRGPRSWATAGAPSYEPPSRPSHPELSGPPRQALLRLARGRASPSGRRAFRQSVSTINKSVQIGMTPLRPHLRHRPSPWSSEASASVERATVAGFVVPSCSSNLARSRDAAARTASSALEPAACRTNGSAPGSCALSIASSATRGSSVGAVSLAPGTIDAKTRRSRSSRTSS